MIVTFCKLFGLNLIKVGLSGAKEMSVFVMFEVIMFVSNMRKAVCKRALAPSARPWQIMNLGAPFVNALLLGNKMNFERMGDRWQIHFVYRNPQNS